jgi:hypothetical protein
MQVHAAIVAAQRVEQRWRVSATATATADTDTIATAAVGMTARHARDVTAIAITATRRRGSVLLLLSLRSTGCCDARSCGRRGAYTSRSQRLGSTLHTDVHDADRHDAISGVSAGSVGATTMSTMGATMGTTTTMSTTTAAVHRAIAASVGPCRGRGHTSAR